MILIFHLLLSEINMHHSSIPNNIQFRINFPFFWKEDFVNNFDTVRDHLMPDSLRALKSGFRTFNAATGQWKLHPPLMMPMKVSQYRIRDERNAVRRLFNMVATWWPAGLGRNKSTPRPGIEPGPPGWKPGILTPRPSGTWRSLRSTNIYTLPAGSLY